MIQNFFVDDFSIMIFSAIFSSLPLVICVKTQYTIIHEFDMKVVQTDTGT